MTPQELERLVRAAELAPLVEAITAASEAERRGARDTARKLRRQRSALGFKQEIAADIALLGTGTWTHVQRLRPGGGGFFTQGEWPAVQTLLLGVRPKWAGRWVQARLDDVGEEPPFSVVHELHKAGLYELGEDRSGYVRAFATLARRSLPDALAAALRTAPAVIEDAFLPMFVLDAGLQSTYSLLPQVCATVAAEGLVERQRLLDEVLQGPLRGFATSESNAFLDVYEALDPTLEEDRARLRWLLELLGVSETKVVGWALGRLKAQVKAKQVPMAWFAPALARVLELPVKGHPRSALTLAARIHRYDPDSEALARALLFGLHHPAPAVVETVLELLEAHAGPELLEELEHIEVPASQATRLAALLTTLGGTPAVETIEVDWREAAALPGAVREALRLDALAAGRLEPVAPTAPVLCDPVPPLATLDAVLDALSAGLATPDAASFEQVLDGVARFADARPGARLDPLLARMHQDEMATTQRGLGPRGELGAVLVAWAEKPVDRRMGPMPYGPALVLSARTDEVLASMKARTPRQLLATPTHARGWLDPGVFVARLLASGLHGAADRIQALLRLAPTGRSEALAALAGTPWEQEPEAYALGAQVDLRPGPLWLAAARSREPRGSFTEALGTLPFADGDRPAHFSATLGRQSDWRGDDTVGARVDTVPPGPRLAAHLPEPIDRWPTMAVHQVIGGGEGAFLFIDPATVAAAAMTWPARPEGLFAAAVWPVELRRDMPPSSWSPLTPFLEPMLGWGGAFGIESCLLLAVSLTHKDGGLRGLAIDIVLDAIDAGRLVGPELGAAFAWLHRHERLSLSRLGATLTEVGNQGPLQIWVMGTVGLEVLTAIEQAPRDLHALLTPLREHLEAHGRAVPPAVRPLLAGLSGRSKTARLAKALLALPSTDPLPAAVTAASLAGRLAPA